MEPCSTKHFMTSREHFIAKALNRYSPPGKLRTDVPKICVDRGGTIYDAYFWYKHWRSPALGSR